LNLLLLGLVGTSYLVGAALVFYLHLGRFVCNFCQILGNLTGGIHRGVVGLVSENLDCLVFTFIFRREESGFFACQILRVVGMGSLSSIFRRITDQFASQILFLVLLILHFLRLICRNFLKALWLSDSLLLRRKFLFDVFFNLLYSLNLFIEFVMHIFNNRLDLFVKFLFQFMGSIQYLGKGRANVGGFVGSSGIVLGVIFVDSYILLLSLSLLYFLFLLQECRFFLILFHCSIILLLFNSRLFLFLFHGSFFVL